jgi:hypothetical protein
MKNRSSSQTRPPRTHVHRMDGRGAVVALGLVLAALCQQCIARSWAVLPVAAPFQADYEEGNILNALLRISQGDTPYPDPHSLPNIINPYGPAAYYLLFIPVKLFGLGFRYPREMIIGCTLLIAALIALELRRRTGSTMLALVFGLLYLTIPNIQNWAWVLRVDLLGIVLSVAGFVVSSSRLDRDEAPGVVPALLFAAGILVKPTLIAAPAACFFALIARRRLRDAAKLTAVTAAAVGVVMTFFAAVTHGAVLVDVFLSHPDPYSLRKYLGGLALMSKQSCALVLLAAVAVAVGVARRQASPPVLWLLIATATSATAGGLGSNLNHFLEWNTALCVAGGLGLSALVGLRSRTIALVTTAIAVTAMAVVIRQPREIAFVRGQTDCSRAYEWVRLSAGPNVVSENVGSLVLGRKRVWVSNPYVLAQMVKHAGWSDAELVHMIRERRFDAVIVPRDYPADPSNPNRIIRFSPSFVRALGDNYRPEPGFNCRDMQVIFKPRVDYVSPVVR